MKHALHLILLAMPLLAACDRQLDENGHLDGMWQLTEFREAPADAVVSTRDDGLYISFQRHLVKFHEGGHEAYYLAHFTRQGDSLFVEQPVEWPSDELRPLTELQSYGIPANGRLLIRSLSSQHLVLSSPAGIASLRKY